jgi:hypothetical protein
MAKRKEITVIDAIRELKEQEPFDPFQIVMASGDKYLIERVENLVEMRTQYFYASPTTDRFVFLRMNQIVGIEHGNDKPAAGRKRRSA